jgi:pyruvate-formate lyase-activating enzyme
MDEAQLSGSARFIASISGVRQVNLLPYHALGQQKRAATTGDVADHTLGDSATVPDEQIDRAAGIFRAAGLQTYIGG